MVWLKNMLNLTVIRPFVLLITIAFLGIDCFCDSTQASQSIPQVCIVVGAEGEPEYGTLFQQWKESWQIAAKDLSIHWIGPRDGETLATDATETSDRDSLHQWIQQVERAEAPGTYWLILMGHGTYDGKQAKFNMRGTDVSAQELATWLAESKHRWVIAVCASSSGPFLQALSKQGRSVITSTKSGSESNFSRFGGYLAQSISDHSSDLDHDQSISVLEAFLAAGRKTERYYEENKLLATEHSLLDDNGDGKGTSVDFFRGIRPIKRSDKGDLDGQRSRTIWLKEPDARESLDPETKSKVSKLEIEIEELRSKKGTMDLDQYYSELEKLLTQLAEALYPASK